MTAHGDGVSVWELEIVELDRGDVGKDMNILKTTEVYTLKRVNFKHLIYT